MNTAEAKLVEALLSGKYEQGFKSLRNNNKYCCLGVACDLYAQEFEGIWAPYDEFQAGGESRTFYPPPVVLSYLNWDTERGYLTIRERDEKEVSLAELNDSGEFTFVMIADIIKAGLISHIKPEVK